VLAVTGLAGVGRVHPTFFVELREGVDVLREAA
jgi:hypothetical protein